MSVSTLAEFWASIRKLARVSLAPDVWVETRRLSQETFDLALATAPPSSWLTTKLVASFRPGDFEFLGPTACDSLSRLVAEFRTSVEQPVPDLIRARECLSRIIAAMEFDRYYDPKAFEYGKKIEAYTRAAGDLPYLTKLKFATSRDHHDNPMLHIWAFLDDDDAAKLRDRMRVVTKSLEEATRELLNDHWPYIHFRTESEQAELENTRAALEQGNAA